MDDHQQFSTDPFYFVVMYQGWMGPNYSISTACATSNFCILNSANHIIKGEAVSILHTLGNSTVW
jgi:3-oxoacyl-(acyl-carrier-protein) synthase